MEITLLSGVRNRKIAHVPVREPCLSFDGTDLPLPPISTWARLWDYLSGSALLRNFNLRVHKFYFQWDLALHLSACILSLMPFVITGHRIAALPPMVVWFFYNMLFLVGSRRASRFVPGFGRFKLSFTASIEEFFSPKLLPVLSISYLLVALSLSVTGRRLGGAPLCYSSCRVCLSKWSSSIPLDPTVTYSRFEEMRMGCGHINGKELLGYYTMAQTSFLLFVTVIIAMAVCMAWRVAEEEHAERQEAEEWLKREDPKAFSIREDIMKKFGAPASFIRPEGHFIWVCFGIVAALTFTLLGWHNWYVLPPSHTATLLIVLNLLTILMSTLILHLGFFGRLLALYQRNFLRVQCLTRYLTDISEQELDAWWNCRSFVLNDDLAIDYDIGGLAVSGAFLINIVVFLVLIFQIMREGFAAIMEPPGSYCAYAALYITMCMIKIFTLATSTFEEQYRHITGLQKNSIFLSHSNSNSLLRGTGLGSSSLDRTWSFGEFNDCGGLYIDVDMGDMPVSSFNMHGGNITSSNFQIADDTTNGSNSFASNNFAVALDLHVPPSLSMPVEPTHNLPSSSQNDDALFVNTSRTLSHSTPSHTPRGGSKHDFDALSLASSLLAGAGGAGGSLQSQQPSLSRSGSISNISMSAADSANSSNSSSNSSSAVSASAVNISSVSSALPLSTSVNTLKGMHPPSLTRAVSALGNIESRRQTLAEMVSQIRKYDPYPCILGIPVMPALFTTCKFYIFVGFLLLGSRVMVSCLRNITTEVP